MSVENEVADKKGRYLTCFCHVTGGVHFANKKLQANDGIDNNDKEDQQSDVKQGNHGFNNGI